MIRVNWGKMPPTTNNLYFNLPKRGRAMSKAYKEWLKNFPPITSYTGPAVEEPLELEMYLLKPDRRKRDISNYIKGLEDSLVKAAIIKDDSLVYRLSMEWVGKLGWLGDSEDAWITEGEMQDYPVMCFIHY